MDVRSNFGHFAQSCRPLGDMLEMYIHAGMSMFVAICAQAPRGYNVCAQALEQFSMGGDDEIEVELRDMCTAEREQVRQTWLKLEWFCKKFTHKEGDPVLSELKVCMSDQVPIWLNLRPGKQLDADFDMRKGKR